MATKKFPSEMSSRGTVLGTDKILIYNATTGASDEVCTVAELFAYVYSAVTTGKVPYKTSTVLADSPIYVNAGDVGLDINSPAAKLHLYKDVGNAIDSTRTSPVDVAIIHTHHGNSPFTGFGGKLAFRSTLYNGVFNVPTGYIGVVMGNTYETESDMIFGIRGSSSVAEKMRLLGNGNLIIGATTGSYNLTLANDSAGKPGAGGLWTVVSDERIKTDIELADLDICYDTIKNIPLKRYAWADGVYSEEQVSDRHNLGWIAQDVQKYFSKAVTVKPFTKNEKIEDGVEEYQEQDFALEDKKVTSIEIINGSPIQVTKTVQEKVLLFDEVEVKDELGKVVLENGKPLLFQVPKMIAKTRPKFRQEVIEDCLDLNSGQLYAAMYGALQKCMSKIESLEQEVALLKQ